MESLRNLLIATLLTGMASTILLGQSGPSEITLHPVYQTESGNPGSNFRVAVTAQLSPGFHVNSNQPLEDFLIPTGLTLEAPDGIQISGLAWPQAVMLEQQGAENPLAVFEEEFAVGVELSLDNKLPNGSYVVPGILRYQACDATMCYLPSSKGFELIVNVRGGKHDIIPEHAEIFFGLDFENTSPPVPDVIRDNTRTNVPKSAVINIQTQLSNFSLLGTTGGYLNTTAFLNFIDRSESGRQEQGWFEGQGPFMIVMLVLLGGLALNLTPCVLPLIPINLAIIGAGTQAGSRKRGFALGSTYGLAMAIVYGLLGLVVILTAGTFGTINSSPWFNLGIAVVFVVLALAMFDIVNIDFSSYQKFFKSDNSSNTGSFFLAFSMGAIAALLAGACVAPVVIQVILFSSSLYLSGNIIALGLPFLLGLGMAIPWPLAGAGLSIMPRPGAWMVRVKQAFGVFILGTAIYYGSLAYGLLSQRWVNPDEVASSVQEMLEEGWHSSLSAALEEAREENKLVLVDVWATWCKNCLTMDQTTLKNENVQVRLDDYVKVKFQAEDPSISPASEVMAHLQGIGLPTYAILRPE